MSRFYNFIIEKKKFFKKFLPISFLKKSKSALVDFRVNRHREAPLNKDAFLALPRGVNLVGDIRMEIGLGQSMRLIANALSLSKYPFGIVNAPLSVEVRRNDHSWDYKLQDGAKYGINLFHINPLELGDIYVSMGSDMWKNHYNIGFWLWELEDFPADKLSVLKLLDEIWTPSEFTSGCFRKMTDKPVYTVPYYMKAETEPAFDRAYFHLPEDKFLFLIMFDYNSTMLRKNPMGAIEAYKKAFAPDDPHVGLVIKINNPTEECLRVLNEALEGYTGVYYILDTLDKPEVNSLIAAVDVFVSLHRSEGFGLVLAEAMLLGTACVATDWSSNTEFMNADTACMVPCTLRQIAVGEGSYPPGATWAEPDVDAAAGYMKRLKEDAGNYQQITDRARRDVAKLLGREKVVGMMEQRLSEIYALFDRQDS